MSTEHIACLCIKIIFEVAKLFYKLDIDCFARILLLYTVASSTLFNQGPHANNQIDMRFKSN